MPATSSRGFTVTGPGADIHYRDFGPAFSAAVSRADHAHADVTFYVHDDSADVVVARVEHDLVGQTRVYQYGKAA